MAVVTKSMIEQGLSELGLGPGDIVVVHASLSSFGRVRGGAKTVVDALLETLGKDGTLLAAAPGGKPYDFRNDPSTLGAVSEEIRGRGQAKRGLCPCMPAAAIGPRAEEFVANHHQTRCPSIGSPWHLAAEAGGYVLLLGVDQDRNTTLHVAEALEGVPYMGAVAAQYVDAKGKVRTYRGVQYAGPHRDFIGIEPALREADIVRKTVIGKCVARLMKGKDLIDLCREELREDPAFFLTPNDGYEDGIDQRGKIRAARIAEQETFTLVARASSAGDNTDEILWSARRAGVSGIEADIVDGRDITKLDPDDLAFFKRRMASNGLRVDVVRPGTLGERGFAGALRAGRALGATAVVWPMTGTPASLRAKAKAAKQAKLQLLLENVGIQSPAAKDLMDAVGPDAAMAFNPANFAAAGELPFLGAFHRVKRCARYVALTDASPAGVPCYLGEGYGEVKEILSILRCASWDGFFCIGAPPWALLDFDDMADAFHEALDNC